MSESQSEGKRPGLLATTAKSVLVIGALSFLAANWLSSVPLDQGGMGRLASNVSRGVEDPVTTGSLGRNAAATRLDPCSTARR